MTQEQREFRIKKITTYEEQIEKLDKKSFWSALGVGISALMTVVSFGAMYGGWFTSLFENLELVDIYVYFCRNFSFWFFVFIAILRTKMNLVK